MVRQEIKKFKLDIGEYRDLDCTAPCSKYSVLLEHGFIGDPNNGLEALNAAVYSDKECCFTSEIDVSALMMSMKCVYLRFMGLDTACRVELNGKEVANVCSAHRSYDFDVKTKITVGKNILKLYFLPVEKTPSSRNIVSSLGSEFSPKLPDSGIFRGAMLVGFNHKLISGVKVKQTHTDRQVRLDLSLMTLGYDEMSRAVATLTSPAGNVYFCGFINGEGSITISEPNLWWPNGLGMQSLYRLNVNLYSDTEIEDVYEMRIGLRTVSMVRNLENGRPSLLINGVPLFPMGASYMPEDVLLSRLTETRTRALLEAAKSANMNSVYIDPAGYYPEEHFFRACDELGLLVWQEIPHSKDGSVDEIKAEMSDNLSRMATHPSFGVIVGSEKIAQLFSEEEEADPVEVRFSDFDGMNVFDVSGEFADAIKVISYDSIPSYECICTFTSNEKRNLGSDVFELHGASPDRVMRMLSLAYGNYPYPNGMNEISYVLGMSSAELSRIAVEDARKSDDRYSGIFMRCLNDTWPTVSPSGVDYSGNLKPLHYFEHRFFAPVAVMVEKKGTRVKFTVTNTTKSDYHGVFAYSIMDNKNRPVFKDSFPIKARASENMEVHNVDLGSVIPGHEKEYYLLYSVSDYTHEASRGVYLFTDPKRFNFLKPTYKVEINGNGTDYTVEVASDCFTKGVEISFPDIVATVDNNYFDITGRAPVKMRLKTARPITVEKLKRIAKLRSVYDLGQES